MSSNAIGGDKWKILVAGGSIVVFTFEAGRVYLEKNAAIKTKKMELEALRKESEEKDQEITRLEAAWKAEECRRQGLEVGETPQEKSNGWFSWMRR